ncbi:hypothetical protein LDENG_00185520, partial [Lucifuga dentata]
SQKPRHPKPDTPVPVSTILFSCPTLSSSLQTQHHGGQNFQLLCTQTLELTSTTHLSAGLHHTLLITDLKKLFKLAYSF